MAFRDWFSYTAEFLPLSANASQNVNVPIQADSDFMLTGITGSAKNLDTDEAFVGEAPAITMRLEVTGTGRNLMDRAVEWANIIGTGQRPYLLPQPHTLKANSTLLVSMTSLLGTDQRVRLAFHGYKLFPET